MPTTKTKTPSRLPAKTTARLKFSSPIVAVVAALVVATGGYIYFTGSHAATLSNWKGFLYSSGCSYDSSGMPVLQVQGYKNNCVSVIHDFMIDEQSKYGQPLWGNGVVNYPSTFDAATFKWVEGFQKMRQIGVDGKVGAVTWLNLDACVNIVKSGPSFIDSWTCPKVVPYQ